jgi:predicted TIM-barrel fold metal-dependent hydrolase
MQIDTQLVFPGFGFLAFIIAVMQEEAFPAALLQECPPNYRAMGYEGVRAANAWAIQQSNLGGRQRHVVIVPTNDLDEMLQVAQQAIDGTAGALWLPSHIPPLGSSPAHPKMDQFWALAAANDIPVVFHINVDRALPVEWQDAPQLSARDQGRDGSVFPINAYFMSTCSIPVENYLLSLVLGGVFERHPSLRVGIIECGAHWLGPTVERMEMWWEQFPNMQKMSRRPTEYVADQVRVTPYFCEPVDVWLERFPQLADVYCFSSDYPHAEGGVDTMERFYQRVAPFGDEILTKFFRTNAELLIPSTRRGSVGRS